MSNSVISEQVGYLQGLLLRLSESRQLESARGYKRRARILGEKIATVRKQIKDLSA